MQSAPGGIGPRRRLNAGDAQEFHGATMGEIGLRRAERDSQGAIWAPVYAALASGLITDMTAQKGLIGTRITSPGSIRVI